MKSGLGNHAATSLDELETLVRSRLRSIQRRPDLINALLGQTGLSLEPSPPNQQTLAFQSNESYRVGIRQTRCLL
ncbi:MAG TPA: hypothetical protein VGD91_31545, partial [Trebonia sp.]